MILFWSLFFKISASFISIVMGFFASKFLYIDKKSIAKILFYFISPVVMFNSIINIELSLSIVILPLLMCCFSTIISLLFYFLSKKIWHDSMSNVVALCSGTANVGYFALPIAIEIFDETSLGIFIICMIGINVFEVSFGYFIASIGNNSAQDSFKKILTLPTIYVFLIGVTFSLIGVTIPDVFNDFMADVRGCYVILGMMMIGFALSDIENLYFDFKFISITFIAKFIAWPSLTVCFIFLDKLIFNLYDSYVYEVLILISVVPMAANVVSISSLLNLHSGKVASTVLLSTIFAVFYVPLITAIFIR